MLEATAALRLSTGPEQGMVMRASHCAASSGARPLPSEPMTKAIDEVRLTSPIGWASWAIAARVWMPAWPRWTRQASSEDARQGRRKTLPAEARMALGFHGLTGPGRQTAPETPKASADRMIVPRLPGSWMPERTTMSGAETKLADCGLYSRRSR